MERLQKLLTRELAKWTLSSVTKVVQRKLVRKKATEEEALRLLLQRKLVRKKATEEEALRLLLWQLELLSTEELGNVGRSG